MENDKLLKETQYFWSFYWAAFFFGFLLFAAVLLALVPALRHDYSADFYKGIVEQYAEARKDADIGVVMLGTSRLRSATTIGYDVLPLVDLPDGRDMAAVQFAMNSARFVDYEDILGPLLDTHPDVILLQDTLIANELAPNRGTVMTSRAVSLIFTKIITGKSIEEILDEERHTLVPCDDRKFDRAAMDDYLTYMKLFSRKLDSDNPNYQMAQDFIAKAVAQGTKVVVLRLDPNIPHFKRLGVPVHMSEYPGLGYMPTVKQLLPQSYQAVDFEHFKGAQGDVYCDLTHFNADGAAIFTDWFVKEVEKAVPLKSAH